MRFFRYGAIFLCLIAVLVVSTEAQSIRRLDVLPGNKITMRPNHHVVFTAVAYTPKGTLFTPNGVRWVASGGGQIHSNGRFDARYPGVFTVTAIAGGFRASTEVHIKPASYPVVRLHLNSSNVQLKVGGKFHFHVTAFDSRGVKVKVQPRWSINARAQISHNGMFTATMPGTYVVTATLPRWNLSARATVVVRRPSHITRIVVTPANVKLRIKGTCQFRATAYNQWNKVVNFNPTWQATGGRINNNGLFRAKRIGTYRISAIHRGSGVAGHATVKVRAAQPSIVRVQIQSSPMLQLRIGQTYNFNAIAYNRYGQPVSFNPAWGVQGNCGVINVNGLFRAKRAGNCKVVAHVPGFPHIAAQITVVVRGAAPVHRVVRMVISPRTPRIYVGQAFRFQLTAFDRFNRPVNCAPKWYAQGGSINNGYYRAGRRSGTFRVWAIDHASGVRADATIVVLRSGIPTPPTPVPGPTGRIIVTKFDIGGNFITRKIKVEAKVQGATAQSIKLYAINSRGKYSLLGIKGCKDGHSVYFKEKFIRGIRNFELRLYDNQNRVIAKYSLRK